jgi:imidazole glycerol-phosphate synthase subunit HisH
MKSVAVIDYGMCNLDSVARAVEECGGRPLVTDREADVKTATHVILPGVGAFADAMNGIRARSLDQILDEHVRSKQIPFLGICLGMQLLASQGTEGGEAAGLGWIAGEVLHLVAREGERVPHVGWNEVRPKDGHPLFHGISAGTDFYFVHSYSFRAREARDVVAQTPYCGSFVSVVGRDAVFGVQFHPEKSQRSGFQVLRNFLAL